MVGIGTLIGRHTHAAIVAQAQDARTPVIDQATRGKFADAIAVARNLNRGLAKVAVDTNQTQAHLGIRLGTDIKRVDDDAINHIAPKHIDIRTLKIRSIGAIAQQHLKTVFGQGTLNGLDRLCMKRAADIGNDHTD